jgi:hypothetical protein
MNNSDQKVMDNFDLSDFDNIEIDILDTSTSAGFPEGGASSRSWPSCSCSCSCPGLDLT